MLTFAYVRDDLQIAVLAVVERFVHQFVGLSVSMSVRVSLLMCENG